MLQAYAIDHCLEHAEHIEALRLAAGAKAVDPDVPSILQGDRGNETYGSPSPPGGSAP
jgi:hypothetical protein